MFIVHGKCCSKVGFSRPFSPNEPINSLDGPDGFQIFDLIVIRWALFDLIAKHTVYFG